MNQTKRPPNSTIYSLVNLRPYIATLLAIEGRVSDHTICEYCLELIPQNKWEIHHTKYDGATYADLMVVCGACNKLSENRNFA